MIIAVHPVLVNKQCDRTNCLVLRPADKGTAYPCFGSLPLVIAYSKLSLKMQRVQLATLQVTIELSGQIGKDHMKDIWKEERISPNSGPVPSLLGLVRLPGYAISGQNVNQILV